MATGADVERFLAELVALCSRCEARIYPRRDSKQMYVAVELGPYASCIVIDLKRVDGNKAERA